MDVDEEKRGGGEQPRDSLWLRNWMLLLLSEGLKREGGGGGMAGLAGAGSWEAFSGEGDGERVVAWEGGASSWC